MKELLEMLGFTYSMSPLEISIRELSSFKYEQYILYTPLKAIWVYYTLEWEEHQQVFYSQLQQAQQQMAIYGNTTQVRQGLQSGAAMQYNQIQQQLAQQQAVQQQNISNYYQQGQYQGQYNSLANINNTTASPAPIQPTPTYTTVQKIMAKFNRVLKGKP